MLFKFIHGEPVTDIKVGRHSCGSSKVLIDQNIPKVLEGADQSGTIDLDFLNHSIFNTEKAHMSKTPYIHQEDEIVHCCDNEKSRLVPPLPSYPLPDKVSLFSKVIWESQSSASVDPSLDINKISIVPTAVAPSKKQINSTTTAQTATNISAALHILTNQVHHYVDHQVYIQS